MVCGAGARHRSAARSTQLPYQGRNDGLTLHLRRRHAASRYVGIELEINQKHVTAQQRFPTALRRAVVESLQRALDGRLDT